MAIDATVGGASADSYLSVAEYDTVMLRRSNAPSGTTAEKETALKAATARLEQEMYHGGKATAAQRLKWPRYGTTDDEGNLYTSTAMPDPLRDATADLAAALLTDPAYLEQSGLAQFEELSIGPIALTPRATSLNPGDLPDTVKRWLRTLRVGLAGQAEVIRG